MQTREEKDMHARGEGGGGREDKEFSFAVGSKSRRSGEPGEEPMDSSSQREGKARGAGGTWELRRFSSQWGRTQGEGGSSSQKGGYSAKGARDSSSEWEGRSAVAGGQGTAPLSSIEGITGLFFGRFQCWAGVRGKVGALFVVEWMQRLGWDTSTLRPRTFTEGG